MKADDRNPDSVVIFVEPPTQIGLQAKQSYNNTKTVAEYSAVVKQVLGNFSDTEIGDQASDVVEFETKLANVTPDAQVLADVNQYYNPFSIKETQSLLPQVSFSEVISKLAPSDYKGDRLIVASPSYMKSLAKILSKTPRGTVQLFLKWKLIQQYADKIEDAKVEPFREFNNKLAGKDPRAREDRWRTCITSLDNGLGWILSRFYVLSYFPKGSKKLGDQMVTELKEWYVSTLRHTDWMSPEVRKRAIQKVHAMAQEVGYPTEDPNVLDAAAVQEYYQGLNMSSQTYFENEVGVAEFQLHQEWSKLGKPTNRDEWGMKAQTVNAYYNPTSNEIVFPAGIMQPPSFYGPDTPMYLNYGAFGSVCGHELSHGKCHRPLLFCCFLCILTGITAFDNHGKDYDATGNYTDWWDEKTTKAFEKRSQCFVDQYSKYTVTGPDGTVYHVNGQLTLGENIADTGGLEAAFNTWRQRHASADLRLPGLTQFTKEQIFFIAHANWWCSKSTPEALVQLIHADPHPPASARVLVS